MNKIKNLGDGELLEKTRELVSQERQITTEVLHHLREVERRRLFSDLGYPSLFEYAVRDLKYSETSASRRISAMRLLKELPELEKKIESGALSLSVISDAQKLFRQEAKVEKPLAASEKRELLKSLEGKSRREAEKVLLARSSQPEAMRPERVKAISPTHSEVSFLATQEMLENLERIRGLLGHSHSEMTMSELVEAMSRIALEKLDPGQKRRKAEAKKLVAPAEVKTPAMTKTQKRENAARGEELGREPENPPCSRYIKAELKREIWRRADGRCQDCKSSYRLQIDHFVPFAFGGRSELSNLRLLCFHCNQRQADLKLGREKMEKLRRSPDLTPPG